MPHTKPVCELPTSPRFANSLVAHAHTTHTADVERVLRDLTDTAEEITQAVKDCGLSRNVACARNVETILSQIENATIDVTEAVSKCAQASSSGKDRTECAGAVAGAAAAFGNIASDIGNAVMACM